MGSLRRLVPVLAALALVAPPAAAKTRPATLVTMHTTGGIAGVDHRLQIGARRHASATSRGLTREFTVSHKTMRRLRTALADAHWTDLRPSYPAKPPVADGFRFAIVHRGYRVRSEDGADRPRRLDRVLKLLERVVSRHGGFV
jgi:hypothetical protein